MLLSLKYVIMSVLEEYNFITTNNDNVWYVNMLTGFTYE